MKLCDIVTHWNVTSLVLSEGKLRSCKRFGHLLGRDEHYAVLSCSPS
jgi:hypothetical protein